jgi:hypothetical protein
MILCHKGVDTNAVLADDPSCSGEETARALELRSAFGEVVAAAQAGDVAALEMTVKRHTERLPHTTPHELIRWGVVFFEEGV